MKTRLLFRFPWVRGLLAALFFMGGFQGFGAEDQAILEFVRQIGGSGNVEQMQLATDGIGNIYLCGIFDGTIQFGDQEFTARSGTDGFLVKYDRLGNMAWVRIAEGPMSDFIRWVAVTPTGEVLVTGFF